MRLRLPRMRLQDRIVLFVVALLVAVQLASFFAIRYAISKTAQDSMREQLRVAAGIFKRLLDQSDQQRIDATLVLSQDFGLRAAIATGDRATVLSALRNHAARVRASGMVVVGPDGRVLADMLAAGNEGATFASPELIERAAALGRGIGVRLIGDDPFRVIVVPVLAPLPIGWLSMDFPIDDRLAREFRALSASHVSFVWLSAGNASLLATTLPPSRRIPFLAQAKRIVADGQAGMTVQLGDDSWEAVSMPLEDSSRLRIYAILQRETAEGLAPYVALQAALLFIAAASLAITLAGSIRVARRITRPVAQLSNAAQQVARGNYAVTVSETPHDEIGDLARAFNDMARGLAERDNVRDVLGKVASSEVVEMLLERRMELGGQELDASVLFTDLRNFTALCEPLAPKQSLAFLNEFLTAISQVVDEHGGVVDKYVGDGVMAIFGAPVPRPEDAQRAVETALEIQRRVGALRPLLAARGMPSPEVGIGINTSRVVAGNVGSPTRLNYTVMGDGVNLASRLESLTKRYHVPIVVGHRTRESVNGIVFRELDKVRVRGKTVAERIWEPLGREGDLDPAALAALDGWHEALRRYRARDFEGARAGFTALREREEYRRPCELYLGYIQALEASPPADDWDAAFTLYDK